MSAQFSQYRPADDYMQHYFNTYITIDNVFTVFFSHMDNGFSSAGEFHDFHEFVYVDHGAIYTEVGPEDNRQTFLLEQGTAYFHAPGVYHRHYVQNNMRGALCIISFYCASPYLKRLEEHPFQLNRRQKELLAATMHYASHLFKGVQDSRPRFIFIRAENCNKLMEQMFKNNLELLFLDFLCGDYTHEQSTTLWLDAAAEGMVEEVQNYLKSHIYSKVNINDICQKFAYSKTTLCNKFKAVTGNSIIQYFNHLKIEEAMNLMENTGDTITNISEKLNFSSCQYFSRVFKQVVGIYPREFKKSISNRVNAKFLQQISTHNEKNSKYFHMLNYNPEQ